MLFILLSICKILLNHGLSKKTENVSHCVFKIVQELFSRFEVHNTFLIYPIESKLILNFR